MNLIQTVKIIAQKFSERLGRGSWIIQTFRPFYENLLNWLSKGKGIPWTINGATYRINAHNRHLMGENYDAEVASFLKERIKPGSICFDVGANVGVYVLQLAHWARPNGQVIAFEPNPEAYQALKEHIKMNHLDEHVKIEKVAVGDSIKEATLYASGSNGMARLDVSNPIIRESSVPIKVPVITLDDYCLKHKVTPDWLLIDVEGYEIAVLKGAKNLLKKHEKIKIIVEMHPNVVRSDYASDDEIAKFFNEWGFRVVPLTGQKDVYAEYGLVYLTREEKN